MKGWNGEDSGVRVTARCWASPGYLWAPLGGRVCGTGVFEGPGICRASVYNNLGCTN